MKENKYLKTLLIQQSFLPLYLLVLIRCCSENRFHLIVNFFSELFHGHFGVIGTALHHSEIFGTFLLCLSLLLFVFSLGIYFLFKKNQTFGFHEETKKIVKGADTTENSIVFFVTYITPFVLDDIGQCSGFFSFITIVVLLFMLMQKTNIYYQNPFLTLLGYKTFYFHFEGEEDGEPMIAITRGEIDPSKIIKRKRIADNVYLVYNKNTKKPAIQTAPSQQKELSSESDQTTETTSSETVQSQDATLRSLKASQTSDTPTNQTAPAQEKVLYHKADQT